MNAGFLTAARTPFRSAGGLRCAARTERPHIEDAFNQAKAMAAGRLLACRQHRRAIEFLGATTTHANQMVMVAMGVAGQLEPPPPSGSSSSRSSSIELSSRRLRYTVARDTRCSAPSRRWCTSSALRWLPSPIRLNSPSTRWRWGSAAGRDRGGRCAARWRPAARLSGGGTGSHGQGHGLGRRKASPRVFSTIEAVAKDQALAAAARAPSSRAVKAASRSARVATRR